MTGGGVPEAEVVLRAARPDEADELTELALRSKAHWGYDDAFMAACRAELTLPADAVAARRTTVALDRATGRVIGLVTLEGGAPEAVLGMLFVDPAAMGRGAGRLLYEHAVAVAAGLGCARISIDADPNAEPFYRAMGAVTVGRVPSGSIAGRTLPQMTAEVPGVRAY